MPVRTRNARLITPAITACILGGGAWIVITSRAWPREDPPSSMPPDLVIALSSGFAHDSLLDPVGVGRLKSAAALVLRRQVPRLVTTRIEGGTSGVTSDYGQRAVIAMANYSGPWTTLAPAVHSTRDEAVALRSAIPGRQTIVVVTSRLHTRRACATFEQVGFTVECVDGYADPRWWRMPLDYLYERAAVLKYRRNGWIR